MDGSARFELAYHAIKQREIGRQNFPRNYEPKPFRITLIAALPLSYEP